MDCFNHPSKVHVVPISQNQNEIGQKDLIMLIHHRFKQRLHDTRKQIHILGQGVPYLSMLHTRTNSDESQKQRVQSLFKELGTPSLILSDDSRGPFAPDSKTVFQ